MSIVALDDAHIVYDPAQSPGLVKEAPYALPGPLESSSDSRCTSHTTAHPIARPLEARVGAHDFEQACHRAGGARVLTGFYQPSLLVWTAPERPHQTSDREQPRAN